MTDLAHHTYTPPTAHPLSLVAVAADAGFYARRVKRITDVLLAAIVLVVLFPVLAVVWLSLRSNVGPGVIFRQRRVGRFGHSFDVYKFRTMEHDRRNDEVSFVGIDRRATHKTTDDPRHTPVGRIVRRFSLDELPQLVNVLKGDMSLVGPRPEMTSRASQQFVAHSRHAVRPGLTGPYQVSDLRLDGDLEPGLPLDADYATNVTALGDLTLVLKTFGVLVRGTGS